MNAFMRRHPVYTFFVALWCLVTMNVTWETLTGTLHPGDWKVIGLSALVLFGLPALKARREIKSGFLRLLSGNNQINKAP